jgi:leucyl/phenylalanyl-tRNA--protein transferase
MPVFQLQKECVFPDPSYAEPEGLLAVGGDLSAERLLTAYATGIFPWFSEEDPILWWSPDPRCVIYPSEVKVSKSMRQVFRKEAFSCTLDHDFGTVIRNCKKTPRKEQDGTWITSDMVKAYEALHKLGYAHSVEVWQDGKIVGGLYGISLGGTFFGESMFSLVSNASKVAFISLLDHLDALSFDIIDCQVPNPHLKSLGARTIPREQFTKVLHRSVKKDTLRGDWSNHEKFRYFHIYKP